jgi:uncharacterized membrane protein
MDQSAALFTNDATVLGVLMLVLGAVFYTERSEHPFWKRFYKYVPALLLCYFIPAVLNTLHVIDGESSQLYFVASRYLLPASLVLLTLSTDIPGILKLGPKALVMFLTATVGIVIGGPIALLIVGSISPETVGGTGPEAVWRGLATVAGSWIGGGANQTAMAVMFDVDADLFGQMIAVDVIVANLWVAVLFFLASRAEAIDARTGADTSAIEELKQRVKAFHDEHARLLTLRELMFIVAIGFGATGLAHWVADNIVPVIQASSIAPTMERLSLTSGFFWIMVVATTIGLGLSFTRLRKLEGAGASTVGSGLLYVLIASIGMRMDIMAIFDKPGFFAIGIIWLSIHAILLLVVGRLIRAPLFYLAVGSQANVGGAASAPVVAAAFSPTLAPVGVLLAVFGYTLGTYAAWVCAQVMRVISTG